MEERKLPADGLKSSVGLYEEIVRDLKQCQEVHKVLRDVNEIIAKASHDTGACYGVLTCAEIAFEHGKNAAFLMNVCKSLKENSNQNKF